MLFSEPRLVLTTTSQATTWSNGNETQGAWKAVGRPK